MMRLALILLFIGRLIMVIESVFMTQDSRMENGNGSKKNRNRKRWREEEVIVIVSNSGWNQIKTIFSLRFIPPPFLLSLLCYYFKEVRRLISFRHSNFCNLVFVFFYSQNFFLAFSSSLSICSDLKPFQPFFSCILDSPRY